MIGSIVIALILWVGFVLLSLWLVSRIARSGMTDSPNDIKVHFSWKERSNEKPAPENRVSVREDLP